MRFILFFKTITATCVLIFITTPSISQYEKRFDFIGSSNGREPVGTPFYDGTYIYGVTQYGGANDDGSIFKILPNGNSFEKLFDFGDTAGKKPFGGLMQVDSFLFGIANSGIGDGSAGNIYKIKPDGSDFRVVFYFNYTEDGGHPLGKLFYDGNYLYGANSDGGSNLAGTIYKIKPDGSEFSVIHHFTGTLTGSSPNGTLISDGTFLYGTTNLGGTNGFGVIYKILPDGSGYTKLHDIDSSGTYTPYNTSLIFSNNILYGASYGGGDFDNGQLFKIQTDGSNFTSIYSFNSPLGINPMGDLFVEGQHIYGVTYYGGSASLGTFFQIDTTGNNYIDLTNFGAELNGFDDVIQAGTVISINNYFYGLAQSGGSFTDGMLFKVKNDGTESASIFSFVGPGKGNKPIGTLLLKNNTIFGMTKYGGSNERGTVFSESIGDTINHTNLFNFDATNGAYPEGSLVADSNFVFGMTPYGGIYNTGVIFKINIDNNSITKIHDFDQPPPNGYGYGYKPYGSLVIDNTYAYGLTWKGGVYDFGTVFRIEKNGIENNYETLHDFSNSTDGRNPTGSLIIGSNNTLYGMSVSGGINDDGTIFSILPDGSSYQKLFDFSSVISGSNPAGSFIEINEYLYGMTQFGGNNNNGVVFKIKKDGTDFKKLTDFENTSTGRYPYGELIYYNGKLYGMTTQGGLYDNGVIFSLDTTGSQFLKLLDFSGEQNGSAPKGSLTAVNQYLFGCTSTGGTYDEGIVFKISPQLLGVNELKKELILKIFPNPGKGIINLEGTTPLDGSSINTTLINTSGQTVYKNYFVPELNYIKKSIDVSNHPPGVYILKITSGKEAIIKKIVLN